MWNAWNVHHRHGRGRYWYWSIIKRSSGRKANVCVYADSVLFVGQVKDIPRAVERWKGQIEDLKMFSFYRDAVGIDGEAIEFELTNFPWLSSLSILREIQQEPEGRFWVQVRKRNCVAIHTVKKDWNCTANEMVQRFKETGHLVSESINALSRVILKQRKGRRTIHFNGDSMNTELLFQTVHSVIQLSVLRSRYEMLLSIQFERRRKRTSWYSCGLGFCPWWSRKKCHCWYWHKQNTPANSIWLSTGPLFCVSRFPKRPKLRSLQANLDDKGSLQKAHWRNSISCWKVWWLDNGGSQSSQWGMWIERQSPVHCRGTRFGHLKGLNFIRAKQNLHMKRKKFVNILGTVAQTESCIHREFDGIWRGMWRFIM